MLSLRPLQQVKEHKEETVLWVAQKSAFSHKSTASGKKTEKKPIDKTETPSYSDRQEIWSSLSQQEQALLMPLKQGECSADDLIAASGLPTGKVLAMLTMLQIRGVVQLLPGKRVVLK